MLAILFVGSFGAMAVATSSKQAWPLFFMWPVLVLAIPMSRDDEGA